MSALSNRINNLSESATIKMAKLGRELAAKGVDVISLSSVSYTHLSHRETKCNVARDILDTIPHCKGAVGEDFGPCFVIEGCEG